MNFSVLLFAGLSAGCLMAGKILIHYFQLESYQFPGYFRTLRRNLLKAVLPGCAMMVLLILCCSLLSVLSFGGAWWVHLITAVILAGGGYLFGKLFEEKKAKKALVFTPRVKRLYAVGFTILLLILCLIRSLLLSTALHPRVIAGLIYVFPVFLPLWIALIGLIAWPIEKGISEAYFRDARRILDSRKDLIRIGITGSWGKTSVKFILGTILEEKYHTLVTPASFNTPMGVTKVIRSRLEPSHRVFVSEMGARHVGDIREMCRLVHPEIGLLTSVGPQHLDTFKTVERVAKTKYELIDALPDDGLCFFADDGGLCRQLYERTVKKKYLSGIGPQGHDVWAENILYSPEGSRFDLCDGTDRIACSTKLLGELNIRNILLASSVALKLGLTREQIVRGISRIEPIEHRLQLIRNPGGITVIDDAFNSNIQGARQAFQVLKSFEGRRIIVTPGMVELGEREHELNQEFGAAMADCCDEAVLVGIKRSVSIAEGLKKGGFPESRLHIVSSLNEATDLLRSLSRPGDVILFENDLPDNYSE